MSGHGEDSRNHIFISSPSALISHWSKFQKILETCIMSPEIKRPETKQHQFNKDNLVHHLHWSARSALISHVSKFQKSLETSSPHCIMCTTRVPAFINGYLAFMVMVLWFCLELSWFFLQSLNNCILLFETNNTNYQKRKYTWKHGKKWGRKKYDGILLCYFVIWWFH